VWVSDRRTSEKHVKALRTLRVIPCEKKIGALFQSQEGRGNYNERRGLKTNDFNLRSIAS